MKNFKKTENKGTTEKINKTKHKQLERLKKKPLAKLFKNKRHTHKKRIRNERGTTTIETTWGFFFLSHKMLC